MLGRAVAWRTSGKDLGRSRLGPAQASRSSSQWPAARRAGMLLGSLFVGVHMALTHGVTLGMVASYIPATEVPGIGRITGTCWSFTDFIFGARRARAGANPRPAALLLHGGHSVSPGTL